MKSIDLSPLYRSSIGFDRVASLLDHAFKTEQTSNGYPPYNIEILEQNRYAITLAVAGFSQNELSIEIENGVLTILGKKEDTKRKYIHQGIADRTFERKFNLAEYVEVTNAELENGLLTVTLVKNIPDAMKPRRIEIGGGTQAIEHQTEEKAA